MIARYNARFGIAAAMRPLGFRRSRHPFADFAPMTRTRSSAQSSSGRAARLPALHLAPDSLGFALDISEHARYI